MSQDEVVDYPTEFLNLLDFPCLPPHILTLQIEIALDGKAKNNFPKKDFNKSN